MLRSINPQNNIFNPRQSMSAISSCFKHETTCPSNEYSGLRSTLCYLINRVIHILYLVDKLVDKVFLASILTVVSKDLLFV